MPRIATVSKKMRSGKWSGYWCSAAKTSDNPTGKEKTYGDKGCGESVAQLELDKAILASKGRTQIERKLLEDFIVEFFADEMKEPQFLKSTIDNYKTFLMPFKAEFGKVNVSQLNDVTKITKWVNDQSNWVDKHQPYKRLRRFFNWLYLKGKIEHIFLARFMSLVPQAQTPEDIEIVTPELHQQILDFVCKNENYGLSFGNFFRLLWSVWGRPHDLYRVKRRHVIENEDGLYIRLKAGEDVSWQKAGGKKRKFRYLVPTCAEGSVLLKQLVDQCDSPEQFLFRSMRGSGLTQQTVWNRLDTINEALGIHLVMYSYRKGAISDAVLKGELTPHQIRAQAGWSTLDMLSHYDMVSDSIEQRQNAVKPKSK